MRHYECTVYLKGKKEIFTLLASSQSQALEVILRLLPSVKMAIVEPVE